MKIYETIIFEICLMAEDAVRCSNEFTYEFGDETKPDIFD